MLSYSYEGNEHLLRWPESNRLKALKDDKKRLMKYTMPGTKTDNVKSVIDPKMKAFYNSHFTRLDTPLNQSGLAQLIEKGNFELALDATSHLLNLLGQGKEMTGRPSEISQFSMELWTVRFQLLMVLKLHAQLLSELVPFDELDAPDLYYQYKNPDKKGSYVPFTMRLIHAEVLRFSPFPWNAVKRIQKLQEQVAWVINKLQSEDAPEKQCNDWLARQKSVNLMEARFLHSVGEYCQSMTLLESVRNNEKDIEEKAALSRGLLRMAMNAGDEKGVNHYTEVASNISRTDIMLHKIMRSIFLGVFSRAQEYAQKLQAEKELSPKACNTIAVVLLYTGKVKEAVEKLESFKKIVIGPMTTNLKTTAELCVPAPIKDAILDKVHRSRH